MTSARRNWSLGPFTAWRSQLGSGTTVSRDNSLAIPIRGARITDVDRGLVYEATIEREGGRIWLSSLTILTTRRDQQIDNETMRRIPAQRIAEQVALQLAAEEAAGNAVFTTRPHTGKHDTPSPEQVAHEVKAGATRQTLAIKYSVSISAADKWIGRSRRAGLIPPATTGRPIKREEQK